jgi:hypothetical protein
MRARGDGDFRGESKSITTEVTENTEETRIDLFAGFPPCPP